MPQVQEEFVMLRCRKCAKVLEHDKLVIVVGGLACPACGSRHFDTYKPKKPPFKHNEVKVTYKEGQGT